MAEKKIVRGLTGDCPMLSLFKQAINESAREGSSLGIILAELGFREECPHEKCWIFTHPQYRGVVRLFFEKGGYRVEWSER